ncbi:MAG: PAS-domain containing protein, partial [Pseudomonadota bacterium]
MEMLQQDIVFSSFAVLAGLLSATILTSLWIRATSRSQNAARQLMLEAEKSITFLFDDERLMDATPAAEDLMSSRDTRRSDWENFLTLLSARFPHLRTQCVDLAEHGKKTIYPDDGGAGWIEAEHYDGLARITLHQLKDNPRDVIDPLTAAAMEHELETLRSIGENAPLLIWKRDADGVLVWANQAYIELSEAIHEVDPEDILPWPPHDVFPTIAAPVGQAPVIDMHQVTLPGQDNPVYYEVTSLKRGNDAMYFAIDNSAEVASRDARISFVQTLTKTFAQLSVGLAIFDSDRRLVLFNPALSDLTGLSVDFLISRPALFAFLDRLRDQNMIPEPKDYTTWRDQTLALETAAEEGNYHETWPLPNGQTFRVTGKPHPNGAVAFLFEDISDDISLTRRFRSQIDTGNAIIDNMEAAIAVFSNTGALVLTNTAYNELWGTTAEGVLSNRDFTDEMEIWESITAPSPVWLKLRETLAVGFSDASWNGQVWLDSHLEEDHSDTGVQDG